MNNSGNCCVGQAPRTSHAATSPKKHVSDASVPRCHGCLQQAPPQVCSWLVVEGILHVIRTRYLGTRTCSWTTLYGFPPFFRLVLPNKYSTIVCCCLLLLYFYHFVIFHVSFSAKVYAPEPHDGGCIRSKKRSSLLYTCLLYTSPSPRDKRQSRMPSSA